MIVKYDNNTLMNKVVPGINSAQKKVPTNEIYNLKTKCPKDFEYYSLLNQVLNELHADITRLAKLENNIKTKNTRINNIDQNIKNRIYSNRIENLKIQRSKL